MRWTLCPKMSFTCSIVDMSLASKCEQHCYDEIKFADSGEMSSGVVILGLVLALVLAQEMQDNRHQHLIHAYQITHQICRPRFLTSPEGHGERYCTQTHV